VAVFVGHQAALLLRPVPDGGGTPGRAPHAGPAALAERADRGCHAAAQIQPYDRHCLAGRRRLLGAIVDPCFVPQHGSLSRVVAVQLHAEGRSSVWELHGELAVKTASGRRRFCGEPSRTAACRRQKDPAP
jgi:hypothetical protein